MGLCFHVETALLVVEMVTWYLLSGQGFFSQFPALLAPSYRECQLESKTVLPALQGLPIPPHAPGQGPRPPGSEQDLQKGDLLRGQCQLDPMNTSIIHQESFAARSLAPIGRTSLL